jgi:hypothetical protein
MEKVWKSHQGEDRDRLIGFERYIDLERERPETWFENRISKFSLAFFTLFSYTTVIGQS